MACLPSDSQQILQKQLQKIIESSHWMKLHIIVRCSVLTVPDLLFITDQKGYEKDEISYLDSSLHEEWEILNRSQRMKEYSKCTDLSFDYLSLSYHLILSYKFIIILNYIFFLIHHCSISCFFTILCVTWNVYFSHLSLCYSFSVTLVRAFPYIFPVVKSRVNTN